MKNKILLLGIVLIIGALVVGAGGPFGITKPEGGYETGIAGRSYPVISSGKVEIIDNEGTVTSFFENFKSGSAIMEESGKVNTFKGATQLGSLLMINGDKYSDLPNGAEFEYKDGTTSITFGEDGGDIIYEGSTFGDSASTTRISGEGKININGGTVTSDKPFTISNGETGDIILKSSDGGMATAELDINGKLSHIGEGSEATIKKYGVDVSGPEGVDVHWGECSQQGSSFCGYDDKIISRNANVKVNGKNAFFESNEGSDFVEFSGGEFEIKKNMVTVLDGEGAEIINGNDELLFDSNGNIFSSKIEGSGNTAMPMDVYTSENGVTAKNYVEVTEAGALEVKEVGLLDFEQANYGVRRLSSDGVYDLSGSGESVSEFISYDGKLASGEEVVDYNVCVDGKCRGLSPTGLDIGTTKTVALYDTCAGFGAECGEGADHTQTIKDLKDAKDSGSDVSVFFTTNEGKKYQF